MSNYPQRLYKPSESGTVKLGDTLCLPLTVADEEEHMAADGYLTADEVLAPKPTPKKRGRPAKDSE